MIGSSFPSPSTYGGRWDIANAARAIAKEARAGRLDPDAVGEECVSKFLALDGMPPPDLCIRTGGERRLSNFLLWDFAYTEFYFTDTLGRTSRRTSCAPPLPTSPLASAGSGVGSLAESHA